MMSEHPLACKRGIYEAEVRRALCLSSTAEAFELCQDRILSFWKVLDTLGDDLNNLFSIPSSGNGA